MSLPSKDDWILKVFTEPLTSSGAKPRTSCPKIFMLRCRFLAMGVGISSGCGCSVCSTPRHPNLVRELYNLFTFVLLRGDNSLCLLWSND